VTTTPRKNFSGLASHLRRLVNEVQQKEFPDLGHVEVCLYAGKSAGHKDLCAHWVEIDLPGEETYRVIRFNAMGDGANREFFLTADDEELIDVITHELLHGEMHRRGLPHLDSDVPFILECLRRGVHVNDESVPAFEAAYGRGTFDTFRAFLPAPKTEEIVLANSAGLLIREVFNSI